MNALWLAGVNAFRFEAFPYRLPQHRHFVCTQCGGRSGRSTCNRIREQGARSRRWRSPLECKQRTDDVMYVTDLFQDVHALNEYIRSLGS